MTKLQLEINSKAVTQEFINNNKLVLNRTPEEMIEYANAHDGFCTFNKEILLGYMPSEKSVIWIKEEAKKEHLEKPITVITDIMEAAQDFLDYMVFAWSKALDERGISASRSIDKLGCYSWLMGREDIDNILRNDNLYNPYGTPALIAACEILQINVPQDVIEFSKRKCYEGHY
jgi:hypothetical protein